MADSSIKLNFSDYKKYNEAVLEILKLLAKNQTTFKGFNICLIDEKYLILNEETIDDFIPSNLISEFRFSNQNFNLNSGTNDTFLRFYLDEGFFTAEHNVTVLFLDHFEKYKDRYVFHNGFIYTRSSKLDFKYNSIDFLILKSPVECKTSKFLSDSIPTLKEDFNNDQ